jgi:hypothetical protein
MKSKMLRVVFFLIGFIFVVAQCGVEWYTTWIDVPTFHTSFFQTFNILLRSIRILILKKKTLQVGGTFCFDNISFQPLNPIIHSEVCTTSANFFC